MIKSRSQIQAVTELVAQYPGNSAITVQYSPFALCGTDEIHAIAAPGALIAHFKPRVLRKVWNNAQAARCYVVTLAEDDSVNGGLAIGLVMEIPARDKPDGTGRPVYYAALIGQLVSGEVNVHRVVRHPKRKAKKVPALGFFDGKFKLKAVAPKKIKHRAPLPYFGFRPRSPFDGGE